MRSPIQSGAMRTTIIQSAPLRSAPIIPHTVNGVTLWELRDWERCLLPGVCGNKARKFASLCTAQNLPAQVGAEGFERDANLPSWSEVPTSQHHMRRGQKAGRSDPLIRSPCTY